VGVWLTQDVYRGQIEQPLTLHRTLYVLANPVNHVDAYGYVHVEPNGYGGCGGGSTPVDTGDPTPDNSSQPGNSSPYELKIERDEERFESSGGGGDETAYEPGALTGPLHAGLSGPEPGESWPPDHYMTYLPFLAKSYAPTGANQCDPVTLYAPLQLDKHTQLPRFIDWLVQPWLHIVPEAQFEPGRDGVMRLQFSNMVFDVEMELGIKNQVRTSTGSPWLVTTSGVRRYLPGGRAWIAAGNGEVSMGSRGTAVLTSADSLTVSAQAWTATAVNVSDRPGTLRYATMMEMPVSAELEGVASVRKTLYFRLATNQYGDRALAETVGVGAAAAAVYYGGLVVAGIFGEGIIQTAPVPAPAH